MQTRWRDALFLICLGEHLAQSRRSEMSAWAKNDTSAVCGCRLLSFVREARGPVAGRLVFVVGPPDLPHPLSNGMVWGQVAF